MAFGRRKKNPTQNVLLNQPPDYKPDSNPVEDNSKKFLQTNRSL